MYFIENFDVGKLLGCSDNWPKTVGTIERKHGRQSGECKGKRNKSKIFVSFISASCSSAGIYIRYVCLSISFDLIWGEGLSNISYRFDNGLLHVSSFNRSKSIHLAVRQYIFESILPKSLSLSLSHAQTLFRFVSFRFGS